MNSFFTRLLDLLSPRMCAICGNRLSINEQTICAKCNLHLPRTHYGRQPYDNEMARLLWGQIPVERVAALFFYEPGSQVSQMIHQMKYGNHPEIGEVMGRMAARELAEVGFFEDIDMIVPVPLAAKRKRERGYNQSEEIAKGVGDIVHLPVMTNIVTRQSFHGSQTQLGKWERNENVKDAFQLCDSKAISKKHILLVDDIMTTGATIVACAGVLPEAGDVRISVLTLGFTKT